MSSAIESMDQDALNNLTAEERAAIEESEYSPTEQAALQRIAGAASDDADDGDDGDDDEVLDANGKPVTTGTAADKTADATATSAAAGADDKDDKGGTKGAADDVVVMTPIITPAYQATLPADYDAKVKENADKVAELSTKFKAGEIEFDDYQAQSAALATEREGLTVARAKAEVSSEMTVQTAQNAWANAINKFYADAAKTDGVDYRKDKEKNSDLDQFVKVLANNEANEDKPMEWFLTEAHKRVKALHGIAQPAPAAKDDKAKVADAVAQRKPPVEALAKNLSQVPGGDGPGDVGSEFAHLDALDGEDLEAAIAKMTPTQREKYARGQ